MCLTAWSINTVCFLSLTTHTSLSSFPCQALLVYYYTTNESLGEAAVSARLSNSAAPMGGGLQILSTSIDVKSIGEGHNVNADYAVFVVF